MDTTFRPGDVVRLKSGGPRMTVESVNDFYGETRVHCSWFEKTKKLSDTFAPTALEKL